MDGKSLLLATANDQKVMLESFDTSAVRDTAQNIVDLVEKSINWAKERYDAEVIACVPPLESRLLIAGGKKAVLSCVTRWTSQRGAGVSFLRNLPYMKKVAAECDIEYENDKNAMRSKPGVSQLLFNADLVESVKELVNVLEPVAELTNYCQKSDFSVALYLKASLLS